MVGNAWTDKLDICKTCGKEVAASAKKCPHCGESYPAQYRANLNKKVFKWAAYSFCGLIALSIFVEAINHMVEQDPVASTTSESVRESGLDAGYANIRVLSDEMLQQLKTAAITKGQSPADLYPANGPIAFIQLPVQSLNIEQLEEVYPLLCEKTVRAQPEMWQTFTDIRILNKFSYAGFSFDLYSACQYPNKRMVELVGSTQIGKWSAEIPFELASTMNTIGYGAYQ